MEADLSIRISTNRIMCSALVIPIFTILPVDYLSFSIYSVKNGHAGARNARQVTPFVRICD